MVKLLNSTSRRFLYIIGVGMLIYVVVNSNKEHFTNPPTSMTNILNTINGSCGFPSMMNSHGSKPAGYNASPGSAQAEQNENTEHVNPMYRKGNPQNTFPEFKIQPL